MRGRYNAATETDYRPRLLKGMIDGAESCRARNFQEFEFFKFGVGVFFCTLGGAVFSRFSFSCSFGMSYKIAVTLQNLPECYQ